MYLRFLICFLLFISISNCSFTLQTPCVFVEDTDYPSCANETCNSTPYQLFFDFGLPNIGESLNECPGLNYLKSSDFQIGKLAMVSKTDLLYTFDIPLGSNDTFAATEYIENGLISYVLTYGTAPFGTGFIECTIDETISCSPTHTPYFVQGFSDDFVINGIHATLNSVCKCALLVPTTIIKGFNINEDFCYFRNISLFQNPFVRGRVCFQVEEDMSRKRSSVAIPIVSDTINPDISCTVTSTDSQDFLLVSRTQSEHSLVIISWNEYVVGQGEFNNTIFTYVIPDDVSDKGGVLNVVITYDDLVSWSTCSVIIKGSDPCEASNLTLINSPWECMSTLSRMIYVLMVIFLIAVVLLVIAVVTYFFVKCLLISIGCAIGARNFHNTKIGRSAMGIVTAAASQFDEVKAMSQDEFRVSEIGLTSTILFIAAVSLFLALCVVLAKILSSKYGRNVAEKISKKHTVKSSSSAINDAYRKIRSPDKNCCLPFVFMFMLSISTISCCSNNFLLDSKHGVCNQDGKNYTCNVQTSLQSTFSNIGACSSLYSKDSSKPFGITITLVKMGYEINTRYMYSTFMADCVGQSTYNCDSPENAGAQFQCDDFNELGQDCTLDNQDSTNFPISPSPYTRCQCSYYENSLCDVWPLTLTKKWAYNYLVNHESSGIHYDVLVSTSIVPFYMFKLEVTDSNPTSETCIVTPHRNYCSIDGVEISLVSEIDTIAPTSPYYFINTNGTGPYYFSSFAQPLGQASSCNLGNIQGDGTKPINDPGLLWYGRFCNVVFSSDSVENNLQSCGSDITAYGSLLPYNLPDLGLVQFINDSSTGYSGLVSIHSDETPVVTLDFQFNDEFEFQINTTSVCPVVLDTSYITGCYDCDTPASFMLTATSNCLEGAVFVSCNEQILNPSVYLTNDPADFVLNFYASQSSVSLSCVIKGTTDTSFKVKTNQDLQKGPVNLSRYGNNTLIQDTNDKSWLDNFNSGSLSPDSYITFVTLLIVGIILVFCTLFILYLLITCSTKIIKM